MTVCQEILSECLDRYERKKENSGRRVIIRADWFTSYNLNDLTDKKVFHQSAIELVELGFIEVKWQKFEEGNLLDRLIFRDENIELAYEWLGRIPMDQINQVIMKDLIQVISEIDDGWIKTFFDDTIIRFEETGKLVSVIPKDSEQRAQFFALLKSIDKGIQMNQRYLSAKLFGDSKTFEKLYRSKLVSIAKKYLEVEWETDQILEYLGIMSNPEEILLKGNIKYRLMGPMIDTGIYAYGTSINALTVEAMILDEVQARRVLTIENKATYYEYIKSAPQDELVIYLGGFFGQSTRRFLTILSNAVENKDNFWHWGDVDLGGLQIFSYLCDVLGLQVKPYKMDEVTYKKYCANEFELSNTQKNMVAAMRGQKWMEPLAATIEALLRNGYRLEQERILIESPLESVNR